MQIFRYVGGRLYFLWLVGKQGSTWKKARHSGVLMLTYILIPKSHTDAALGFSAFRFWTASKRQRNISNCYRHDSRWRVTTGRRRCSTVGCCSWPGFQQSLFGVLLWTNRVPGIKSHRWSKPSQRQNIIVTKELSVLEEFINFIKWAKITVI